MTPSAVASGVYTISSQPVTSSASTLFSFGQRVQTRDNLNVRSLPSLSGSLLGTQLFGNLGTVSSGGIFADGFFWWNINYDSGADGWSAENFLKAFTGSGATTPDPTPTGTGSNTNTNTNTNSGSNANTGTGSNTNTNTNTGTDTSTGTGITSGSNTGAPSVVSGSASNQSGQGVGSSSGGGGTGFRGQDLVFGSGVRNTTSGFSQPVSLTRNLGRGSEGQDVIALQTYLISRGFLSADSNTGFFGPLTEEAVRAFQRAENIVSSGTPKTTGYGSVGPQTREKLALLTTTQQYQTGLTLSEPERQAMIRVLKQQLLALQIQLLKLLSEKVQQESSL